MTPATPEDAPAFQPVGRYDWERIVRRAVMPVRHKLVALVLATYADANGTRVRPGMDVLAAVTGQGESTVRRLVTDLRGSYGLLEVVTRGGGRKGRGKATEYRLVLPVDLLERIELLPPGDVARRASLSVVSDDSPLSQGSAQSEDSPLSQESAQSDVDPVDNSDSPLAIESAQSDVDEPIDRSENTVIDRMTAQKARLSALQSERLPATTPTTTDQQPGPDPTQLTTARESIELPEFGAVRLKPAKCPHGLPAHISANGPTCPLCRRLPPAGGDPP
jgi:hypothetical protein